MVFIAGPVRSDAEGKRLQEVVRAVKGVAKVSVQRGTQEGTVRLMVISPDQGAFPRAFNAARAAGFSLQVAEVNGRPAGGDVRREGKGFADDEVRPDGKGRPEGDNRREGKERFQGDFPREGKVRPGGDYRPDGKSKGEEGRDSTLIVGPVRSDQEAAQLRQVLLRVEGVRGVVLKPGERPNTAIVTLAVAGEDAIKRATRDAGLSAGSANGRRSRWRREATGRRAA